MQRFHIGNFIEINDIKCHSLNDIKCHSYFFFKNMEEKLRSLELWFFRRMMKVSWLDRQSNEIVLDRFGSHRSLINVITKRQVSFLAIYVEKTSLKIWLAQ